VTTDAVPNEGAVPNQSSVRLQPDRQETPIQVVRAENLSKWYGQVIGLNDITITIGGGVTGLLGPNGAGKSTLLKLITGQLKPNKGTVKILGERVWGNPDIFMRVGVCPEQDAFYDRMTGHEWVTALLRLHGLGDRQATDAAMAALEQVDLKDAANKRIGAYSKGMRQRVKLAQALAHEPELLVLDEPLSGMDPLARRKTIRLLRAWAAKGRHVIVSSHILHEVEALTSDILLMHHGRVLAEGNVHQIRDLIDEHPHTVCVRSKHPRTLATTLVANEDVLSVRFEEDAVYVQTARPDAFYARVTEMAANGGDGEIYEITSPDDNLQAVFEYLVNS
jgi:ABC-2 type transport system ATP-binding protein